MAHDETNHCGWARSLGKKDIVPILQFFLRRAARSLVCVGKGGEGGDVNDNFHITLIPVARARIRRVIGRDVYLLCGS